MKKWAGKFDFLLNTIPVGHDLRLDAVRVGIHARYRQTIVLKSVSRPLDEALVVI